MTDFIAPIEKFRDYIFKPGAIHGKDYVFRSLGYDSSHSEMPSALYSTQAAAKFAAQEYLLGKADRYGQRIDVEIELAVTTLTSEGIYLQEVSFLRSGWMLQSNGDFHLTTPFSGVTRNKLSRTVTS